MMLRKALLTAAAIALASAFVFAAPDAGAPKGNATVGEFVTKGAQASGHEVTTPKAAVEALRGRGVSLAVDLSSPLTSATVARIAADLGVRIVQSATPEAVVSQGLAGQLATALGAAMDSQVVGAPPENPPSHCLTSVERGTCVNCCKDASGLTGKFCGRYCHANVPPPISPEEPMP